MKTDFKTITLFVLSILILTMPAVAADYNAGVAVTILKKASVTSNGQPIAYPKTDRPEVTALTVDLAPGAETGWHKHSMPVYAYVVSGRLTVDLEDGKQLSYGPGEVIYEVVDTLHNGKNSGTVPVRLAVFYLGAAGVPNVIKPQ